VSATDADVLWRPEEHEALIDQPWDEAIARAMIETIVADAEAAVLDGFWPGHPLDDLEEHERLCGLYLGSGGMVWGLSKLESSLDGRSTVAAAIARYRAAPDLGSDAHAPSLLLGETGLLVVADKVGSPAADTARLRELVHENRRHPTWELMWGSPGTMLAARACGLLEEWRESASLLWAAWDDTTDVWKQDMYGQVRCYLGPVHGFAGNVLALRGYVDDDVLRARVTRLVRRTAGHQGGLVNWPPLDQTLGEAAPKIRVQWCHGAPGMISALGDLMPPDLAIGGGELVWRAGPLRKGPGLCHGTAGNGFAFLTLHELTGDPLWLERARRFAMHAIEQVRSQSAQYGRGRYTLWTGDLGVALYLNACLHARAAFPTIDFF
jgi:Lanthionine synthetase C-like protein